MKYAKAQIIQHQLESLCVGRVLRPKPYVKQHGDDLSWNEAALPDLVVTVQSNEEISQILKLCNDKESLLLPMALAHH